MSECISSLEDEKYRNKSIFIKNIENLEKQLIQHYFNNVNEVYLKNNFSLNKTNNKE